MDDSAPDTLPVVPFPRERLKTSRDQVAEAKELRDAREDIFDVSQAEMAHVLGVSVATYYRWETGKVLIPLTAVELVRVWVREERAAKKPAKKK
jgi:DNA-binding transcriptional regulator YiaG